MQKKLAVFAKGKSRVSGFILSFSSVTKNGFVQVSSDPHAGPKHLLVNIQFLYSIFPNGFSMIRKS